MRLMTGSSWCQESICVLHHFVRTQCPELISETIPPGIVIMGIGGGDPAELS